MAKERIDLGHYPSAVAARTRPRFWHVTKRQAGLLTTRVILMGITYLLCLKPAAEYAGDQVGRACGLAAQSRG